MDLNGQDNPNGLVTIRRLTAADGAIWLAKRTALWSSEDTAELASEVPALATRDDFAAFGAFSHDGICIGFVEVGSRPYAEGCSTSPVGYVEGLWVDADVRRRGIARLLVEAAKSWARAQGFRELGSDAVLDNTVSHAMHGRLGFTETERLVTFLMKLD